METASDTWDVDYHYTGWFKRKGK